MSTHLDQLPPGIEYPPKADLRRDVYRPLPKIPPGTVNPANVAGDVPLARAQAVVNALNAALSSNNADDLADCFYPDQAFWRDIVALTSHLRTLIQPKAIAGALLQLNSLRVIEGAIEISGEPVNGKMVLLPMKSEKNGNDVSWKILVLSTWVEQILQQPENEGLLSAPGRNLNVSDPIETDVFIVGAGTSGLMMAARLKALGIESVIIDRNAQVGENWSRRFDSLKLHVPTSNCEMPYFSYSKEQQSPHRLTKDEVAVHLQQYASKFHLNVISSTTIQSSSYDLVAKKWTLKVKTADHDGYRIAVSKHLVQASGIGSGQPFLPSMDNESLYSGIKLHSSQYRNAKLLAAQGVKSVVVIGSANTAFDVIQNCYDAGLKTTMVARSPTYVFPYEYVMDPHGIGAYDLLPLEAADEMLNTFPLGLDGQLSHGLFSHLNSLEPDRYTALSKAGFPVLDSRDPSADVQHHLVERGGGHYIDVGGTRLIAEGKVAVRGLVEPVAYSSSGLCLSDGSTLDAEAVIWCTGFADKDVRSTAERILGADEHSGGKTEEKQAHVLGPKDIAARLDATWGVDAEGEVRGMWKRHLRMENYWVIGGVLQHQRWWSKALAQQIKLALLGDLPPAYRDTPAVGL